MRVALIQTKLGLPGFRSGRRQRRPPGKHQLTSQSDQPRRRCDAAQIGSEILLHQLDRKPGLEREQDRKRCEA